MSMTEREEKILKLIKEKVNRYCKEADEMSGFFTNAKEYRDETDFESEEEEVDAKEKYELYEKTHYLTSGAATAATNIGMDIFDLYPEINWRQE